MISVDDRGNHVAAISERFLALKSELTERGRRIFAGVESRQIGHGGDSIVSEATGMSRTTVKKGRLEIGKKLDRIHKNPEAADEPLPVRIRSEGAGRPSIEKKQPGILKALESLIEPVTPGDPQSPLRWTSKSCVTLSDELNKLGFGASPSSTHRMMKALNYSLQSVRKKLEGSNHPDRDAQFDHINTTADEYLTSGQPVISCDTKKKELVGKFSNSGREWQPKDEPLAVNTYNFPSDAEGKAIPYGVYDMKHNQKSFSLPLILEVAMDIDVIFGNTRFKSLQMKQIWQLR